LNEIKSDDVFISDELFLFTSRFIRVELVPMLILRYMLLVIQKIIKKKGIYRVFNAKTFFNK
jgi:hypothetical protein